MTLPCEIVKDMLVLYADDALGRESRTAVEDHLNQCPSCREYLEHIKEEKESVQQQETIETRTRKFHKRIRKTILLVVMLLFCVVLLGGWWLFTTVTTDNPNVFVTTHAYLQLYVFGKGHVTVSEDPLTIYCEARYRMEGTRQLLSRFGFEDTGEIDDFYKRRIMVRNDEVYYADIYDNRFLSRATVTKAELSPEEEKKMVEAFHEPVHEVSTGE